MDHHLAVGAHRRGYAGKPGGGVLDAAVPALPLGPEVVTQGRQAHVTAGQAFPFGGLAPGLQLHRNPRKRREAIGNDLEAKGKTTAQGLQHALQVLQVPEVLAQPDPAQNHLPVGVWFGQRVAPQIHRRGVNHRRCSQRGHLPRELMGAHHRQSAVAHHAGKAATPPPRLIRWLAVPFGLAVHHRVVHIQHPQRAPAAHQQVFPQKQLELGKQHQLR
ncbi:hypothetical protein EG19_01820 [Thermoanaerobaculum aquaticum]|uniref:Uncharacterized protein n=1 Tax=Thermoanaerobaculum aquaticum TaxID=1312852 RepID=A0A062XZN0_9BACT|nr:hypothetical protein EG19_01820 [Thermoanaerobaculum aquaticum]